MAELSSLKQVVWKVRKLLYLLVAFMAFWIIFVTLYWNFKSNPHQGQKQQHHIYENTNNSFPSSNINALKTNNQTSLIHNSEANQHTDTPPTDKTIIEPQCILPPNEPPSSNSDNRRMLVIGGMSHVGMKLAMTLHKEGKAVTVLEDLLNVDSDPLKWDRWSELVEMKIESSVVEFKDEGRLMEATQKALPSVVIYVPTLFFHPVTTKPGILTHQPAYGSVVLKEFLRVAESVRKRHHNTRFIVVSGYTTDSIHQQWLKSLESIFSAYQLLHKDFSTTLVKLPKLFGPWQDPVTVSNEHYWYIDDVISVLQQLVNNVGRNCSIYSFSSTSIQQAHVKLTKSSVATSMTQQWTNEYMGRSLVAKNVTFGAYFVHLTDNYYMRQVMSDHFSYMQKWMVSGHKFGLQNILFHDRLSPEFVKRVEEVFSNAVLLQVKSRNDRKSPNDQRFYFIYDYLLSHKDIGTVVASDVKDVEFLINPATVMKAIGDYFYVGKDVGYILYTDWLQRNDFVQCFHNGDAWRIEESVRLFGFLNVGVLGGTRASMLAGLTHFIHCLSITHRNDGCCCDMSISQYVYHAIFFNQLFIGYPFNTAFKTASPGPFGMAVKHKATFDDI